MTVANPTSIEDHIEHVKLRLGFPVVRVNVSDDQFIARIKESKQKFEEFHDEAVEQYFLSQEIKQEDLERGFFVAPDSVRDVIQMLSYRAGLSQRTPSIMGGLSNSMSGVHMNGMNGLASGFGSFASPAVTYYLMQMNQAYYDVVMNAPVPYTWNRFSRRLRVRDPAMRPGNFICYEATVSLIDEGVGEIWSNDWFLRYSAALCKQQWGVNLGKFENVQLPGGIVLNGAKIKDDAEKEIERLLEELMEEHNSPPAIMFG